jgi:hypothetical protein
MAEAAVRESLGMSVTRSAVHAVWVKRGAINWAAHASYGSGDELVEVIASLVSECVRCPKRVRVVLGRDLVQFRTVVPAPRLGTRAARSHVTLQASRLFRRNGAALITDAFVVRTKPGETALLAAAVADEIPQAVANGCSHAGIRLDALGAAAEVLPWTTNAWPSDGEFWFRVDGGCEVVSAVPAGPWRSRMVSRRAAANEQWVEALSTLGDDAAAFAAAFGAAVRRPRLELIPQHYRAARRRERRVRVQQLLLSGAALWLLAAVIHASRLTHIAQSAEREIAELSISADSALALRRDMRAAQAAVSIMTDAQRKRSRTLEFLAYLSLALSDSTFLVSLRSDGDSLVRLAGYSKSAARALLDLEQVAMLDRVDFETYVTRETLGPRDEGDVWDRFAVVGRRRAIP